MKTSYRYPALFHYGNDGISMEFPDLPGCLPCAFSDEEAFKKAKEALSLHLYCLEQDGDDIPVPTPVSELKPVENEVIAMIEVFMPSFRDKMDNRYVKKTLSIPSWLNSLAEEKHVNFSRVLQDALKRYLDIRE